MLYAIDSTVPSFSSNADDLPERQGPDAESGVENNSILSHSVQSATPPSPESNPIVHGNNASDATPSSPKACLAMIMKNEGPILPRLFESVKGFVSEYCVVDTGSTDNTMDVLRSMDMPGLLVEEPFVDFATTRNFLLDTCRERTTCEYLVLLDADMVLKVSPEWDWAKIDDKDVYNLIQVSSVEYENVRIIKRTAGKIKVVGATHEYYDVPSEYVRGLLPKRLVYIDDVGDGKAKGNKFERDERLLRRELEQDPNNVRAVFYLANTLKDRGRYREAITLYERRATMGGWFAEADYSLSMLSTCYLELHDLANARKYAELAAFTRTAKRAEPLYYLAFYLHRHAHYEMAWHYATLAAQIPKPAVARALFIANNIYDHWIQYEKASLCRHVFPSEPRLCLETGVAFLNNWKVPEDLIEYYYPDLKEVVQPLLTDETSDVLYNRQASPGGCAMRVTASGAIELLQAAGDTRTGGALSYQQLSIGPDDDQDANIAPSKMDVILPDGLEGIGGLQPLGRKLVGHATDGKTMYIGGWSGDGNSRVEIKAYTIDSQFNVHAPWALFEAADGSTYCVTQWHPTLDIGRLEIDEGAARVRCEFIKSIHNVPRSFTFFRTATHGILHGGDGVWLLVQSRRADTNMLSVVVLGSELELRAYTLPFTLKGWGAEREDVHSIQTGLRTHSDRLVLSYTASAMKDDSASKVHRVDQVPLVELWRLMTIA